MEIGLTHYLTVAAILFTIGVFGIFLNRKNVIVILMSIELMLLAVNINLVAFSSHLHLNDLVGQLFALFVLTVASWATLLGPFTSSLNNHSPAAICVVLATTCCRRAASSASRATGVSSTSGATPWDSASRGVRPKPSYSERKTKTDAVRCNSVS